MSFLLALAAVATAPLVEQNAASPTSSLAGEDTIVVQGSQEVDRGELREIAKDMSDSFDGHLPRYDDDVCMGMTGLTKPTMEAIVDRFRETSASLGVELLEPGCKINLMVLVTTRPKELIKEIRYDHPMLLQTLAGIDRRRLYQSDGPVWVWRNVFPHRADGGPARGMTDIQFETGNIPRYAMVSRNATWVDNVQMGRLRSAVRMTMARTFIVLDANALVGFDSDQIGDFLAVAGLSPANLRKPDQIPEGSILRMFTDEIPPPAASDIDRAYLAALYSGEGGQTARQKLSEMSRKMQERLDLGED